MREIKINLKKEVKSDPSSSPIKLDIIPAKKLSLLIISQLHSSRVMNESAVFICL